MIWSATVTGSSKTRRNSFNMISLALFQRFKSFQLIVHHSLFTPPFRAEAEVVHLVLTDLQPDKDIGGVRQADVLTALSGWTTFSSSTSRHPSTT